ncbi:hypothetical protein CP_1078 [Chlamydia pneumoniae AR39]|uniref:Uncharacterized protein n=1 Tax=Chlamydia pneumoniae TaxID=83558 RepID=Q9K1S7_CHLPN|nr:hypothetical protein CP_1078 [Chlamydia pneumoniae AR39]
MFLTQYKKISLRRHLLFLLFLLYLSKSIACNEDLIFSSRSSNE